MKRRFLLIMLLMAMFAPLAMQAQGLAKAPRGTVLQMVAAPNCEKQTATQTRDGWLQYDNGSYLGATGASQAYEWEYGPMYPSSMLGTNNTLTKVAFQENTNMISDVVIKIYAGGDNAPGTLVYSETVTRNGSTGMHEVELASPVTIDPSQNLWITVTVTGTSVLCVCQSSESNNNWVENGGWYHLSDLSASLSGYGWMIRGYVEYVDAGACPKPTQFTASNITLNTATLSWNGEARSYQLVYGDREGFDPDSATPIDVNETSYTLTNLTDGTTYYAYVRANCGDSYSEWNSKNFTTISACATPYNVEVSDITPISANISWDGVQDSYTMRYMVPSFYDGFENDLEGWTVYTQGTAPQEDGWYTFDATNLENGTNHNGNNVACSWSWSTNPYSADNYLVTPQVTFGSTLLFWEYTNANYPDSYEVLLSTTGNAIADFTVTLRALQPASTEGWHQVAVDLSAYANQQGYIAIHHVDYDMNYLFIDDFCIGNWTPVSNVASPYAFANLTPETTYVAQIQGICPGGTTEWSDGVVINTPSSCQGPSNPASANVTGNSATLSWEGYQDSYNIQYRTASYRDIYFFDDFENGNANGWINDGGIYYFTGDENNHFVLLGYTSTETQYLITPELPEYAAGSTVEFEYRINGTETTFMVGYSSTTNDETAFSWGREIPATTNDITLFSEVIPTGTKYIAIQTTGVAFIVDNFGIYDPTEVPAGNWETIEGETSPYTLSGLAAETEYEWQVQGINPSCDGGVTEWSESAFFTTLPLCLVPTNLDVDEVTTNSAVLTWVSDATSFDIEVNEVITTGVTSPYTLNNLDPGTLYSVRVRANCSDNGNSDWTTFIRFYTKCEAFDLPYTYGFEDLSDLVCWNMLSANDNAFGVVNIAEAGITEFEAYEGDNAFVFSSYDESDSYAQLLMSPELNSGNAAVAFEFSYIVYGEGTEDFLVLYSTGTDDLDDFEVADAISADNTDEWLQYQTILPAGTKYVALYYYSDYQYYLFVDAFSFEEATTTVTQETSLVAGWNWFSTYVEVEDPVAMLQAIEESLGENGTMIKNSRINTEYDAEWGWFGDLDDEGIVNEQMYKIQVSAPCTVTVEGTPANPEEHAITVNYGWNWIGFPCQTTITLENAFDGFAQDGDKIRNSAAEIVYDPEWGWFGDFETLVPGQGYMYYSDSTTPRRLVFPTGGAKARNIANLGNLAKPAKSIAIGKSKSIESKQQFK